MTVVAATRAALAAALGMAAALLAGRGLEALRLGPPSADAPLLAVPDDDGALSEILIHHTRAEAALTAPTWRDLLRALPPEVGLRVVVEDEEARADLTDRMASWGLQRPGSGVSWTLAGHPITTWSRDRYTLLAGGSRRALLVPPRGPTRSAGRDGDWLVPFQVAREVPGLGLRMAPFIFDGGDFVVGGGTAVAMATWLARARVPGLEDEDVLRGLARRELGRPLLVLGDSPEEVPDHHICIFVALLPGRIALVGDVRRGRDLVAATGIAIPGADLSEAMADRVERLASGLEAAGFQVRRLPLVPVDGGRSYLTYQNGLVERRGGRTRFYMPTYGLPALDEAARREVESLGVEVLPVEVSGIWRLGGSLRCLVNVLRREG
ncbi:MAG: hypothetical protein HY722_07665 [Planctomycetes bacterium]|nr:hypothetical protein [Planctomycetota bacterium]